MENFQSWHNVFLLYQHFKIPQKITIIKITNYEHLSLRNVKRIITYPQKWKGK